MTQLSIRGNLVVLRSKSLEDAWKDYQWRVDPELARLDATEPLRMSFQEYLQFYREELRYPLPDSRRFAIETLDGEHIGNCMCYDIDTFRREAEIGIMIGERDYWSKGYGYDAMVTLVDHIFRTLPVNKLYLHTLEWNNRAKQCFLKCGFVEVGQVRRNGRVFVYMELPLERWQSVREEKLHEPESQA